MAALPGKPLPDSAVAHVGMEQARIAELYCSLGDDDSGADWYRKGAAWSLECGNVLRALVLAKQSLKLRPDVVAVKNLYAKVWRLAGLGDTPEPIG